jgi:hypothetical protein
MTASTAAAPQVLGWLSKASDYTGLVVCHLAARVRLPEQLSTNFFDTTKDWNIT